MSWITGEVGFAFVTVPEAYMNHSELQQLNQEFKGQLVIQTTGTDSHMWNGSTTCAFLDQMTIELRKRRALLGYQDNSARALAVCDRCTSHMSRTYLDLRRQWAKEQNVLLVGCDPDADIQVPGGWGLSCSPNDGWHSHFHLLRMTFMRSNLGMPKNPLYREEMKNMEMSVGGNQPALTCPLRTSLQADAWALAQISTYAKGKVITWAWVSRGFLTPETAAKWHCDGDLQAFEDHMKKVRGGYRELLHLRDIPPLDGSSLNLYIVSVGFFACRVNRISIWTIPSK